MAGQDVTKVEGFQELNRKLKTLDDRTKRREVLKIQRRLAKPIIEKYSANLPRGSRDKKRFGSVYPAGTLKKSVKADTVPIRAAKGNPAIAIRPGKKGKADAYYRFMVIAPGTKTGSTRRGSRTGKNNVVSQARDKTLRTMGNISKEYVDKTAAYIQKQIKRLSK